MLKIINYKITELIPYQNNARTHSEDQIKEIVNSIKEFGFNNPILIDEKKMIIAGHGRLLAAALMGLNEVPTIELKGLSETKKRAYILADNRIALNAGWSSDKLQQEFEALLADNFDITLTGFTSDEINSFLNPEVLMEGLTDQDSVPSIEQNIISKLNDVWLLGNHRLMCGDSTNPNNVDLLLNNEKPNLMITDPPYGVNYEAGWRAKAKNVKATSRENNNSLKNDNQYDWHEAYSLFEGNIMYVWHASAFTDLVMEGIRKCDFEIKQQIIWNKNVHALSRSDYHWKHEPCWYAIRKNVNHSWNGSRKEMTVWDIKSIIFEKEKTEHPTQKPVEIYLIPIENHTKFNDFIYDPFGGSGTLIIACEKTNRKALIMEIDPKFCDVIIKRWQNFTGKKAILESTQQTFEEIANACQEKEII
jgi:DNA modification methylase